MMAIIIVLGAGITLGYFYKRYCSMLALNINRHNVLVTQQGTFTSRSICVKMPDILIIIMTHPVWGI